MSAETVVKKIEEKASAEVEAIKASAAQKAEQIRNAIKSEAERKARDILSNAGLQAELTVKRADQQARLERRISNLDFMHELLDGVREDVKRVMLAFDGRLWAQLYTRLVGENAINGFVKVRIPEADKARYSDGALLQSWSDAVTAKTGIKTVMTLADEYADIDGGLILCGEKYDVDLSFDAVLDEVFSNNEKAISDKLFGN
ncbi:MAG: V-type ATP synthase subunit E family protein [Eubacteriales bacterium]|nr:V-type ATP synthase subunit E family protein [Eubacteriales bacterium]